MIRTDSIALPALTLCCGTAGHGPTVLFVHGFLLCGALWHATVATLAKSYRCIIPDLRGHGGSQASATTSIAEYADDLAALLDALHEPAPVVVVGLSLGGIVALEFFRRHRRRVRALGLLCCRANPESDAGRTRWGELIDAVSRQGGRAAADSVIDRCFAPGAPAALRTDWYGIMARTPVAGILAGARALADRPDGFATLPSIDVPTFVVAGADDVITDVATLRLIHERIADSEFVTIPHAGHLLPVEQPAALAATLHGFLDRLP